MGSDTSAGLTWMLFGSGLIVSNGIGLPTTTDAFSLTLVFLGVAFVLVGIGRTVDPGGKLLGLRYAPEEEPRWVLAVLAVAGFVMVFGTTIKTV